MHVHLIASIRQANIYRSIGNEKGISKKRWRMVDCMHNFVESTCNLQSIEYEKR
jgi:hypothetical protein